MDVRAKQRLCYRSFLVNPNLRAGGFAPRHLKRSTLSGKFRNRMQKVVFIFLLILFCNLNISAQTKITPEEYAVYASVLKAIYKDNRETYSNKSHFAILRTELRRNNRVIP